MLEYFGGGSLLTQSHGQSLISFFTSRYKIKGVYFLDEPETALSPKSQLKLLRLLKDVLTATHHHNQPFAYPAGAAGRNHIQFRQFTGQADRLPENRILPDI
jgi:hypothetical protein